MESNWSSIFKRQIYSLTANIWMQKFLKFNFYFTSSTYIFLFQRIEALYFNLFYNTFGVRIF